MKKNLQNIQNSKKILKNIIEKSNYFKNEKINLNKFSNDDNKTIQTIIKNYSKTKIKKNKKILIKQLKYVNFKKLKKLGMHESARKTFLKYQNKNYKKDIEKKKNEKNIKKEKKKNFLNNFLKNNCSISAREQNVYYYNKTITKLFSYLKLEIEKINKNKKKEDYYIKISESYFRKYLKENNSIFKKSKLYTDYCPNCFYFEKKKNLDENEKKIFDNHIEIKNIIEKKLEKCKFTPKKNTVSVIIDFKQNFYLNKMAIELCNGKLIQNSKNYFNYSSILCFGMVAFYSINNIIKKR
jgi:hypothetical protein